MATERTHPRISLNALTEYLTANAARRRRIVEEQKRPSDFQVIYYQYAQTAISQFIGGQMANEALLIAEMDRLDAQVPQSDYEEHRLASNIQAIQSFLNFYDDIDLAGMHAEAAPADQPKLQFEQIDLSVRPEVILTGNNNRQGDIVGAVKLYFSKSEKMHLTDESAAYPGALVHEFLTQTHPNRSPLHRRIHIVDVFGGSVFNAPRSTVRLLNDIRAACEEIRIWWPQI